MSDRALARSTDPETSHESARLLNVTRVEEMVLITLTRLGGRGSSYQIAVACPILQRETISSRLKPLERKGKVRRDSVQMGSRGRPEIVWAISGESIQ